MFASYIAKSGQTRSAWAKRIGVSRSYLSDMLNGNRVPSLSVAARIERATKGEVPAVSWVAEDKTVPEGFLAAENASTQTVSGKDAA